MAKKDNTYTAGMMAESLGIDTRELRGHLRALKIEKPAEGWQWAKKGDCKDIEKQVAGRIKELAAKKAAKADAPVADAPKGKGKKKAADEAPVEETKKGKGKKKAAEADAAETKPKGKGKKAAAEPAPTENEPKPKSKKKQPAK